MKNVICLLIFPVLLFNAAYAAEPAEEAFQKGISYSQKQSYDEAIAELTRSIQIKPTSRAYSYRAYLYLLKNSPKEAIADCNEAIAIDPANAQAYNNRAAAHQQQNDFDKAISDCDKAIGIDPNIPYFYKNRALANFSKKEYDLAWQDIHKAQALGFKPSIDFLESLKKASGREK